MLFYEKFQELLKNKGCTIADVSNNTGLPYTTVDSIIKKKIGSKVGLDTALKIAAYFDICVDEFINVNCRPKKVPLPADVKELIECYKLCDGENKEELLLIARHKATKSTTAACQTQGA